MKCFNCGHTLSENNTCSNCNIKESDILKNDAVIKCCPSCGENINFNKKMTFCIKCGFNIKDYKNNIELNEEIVKKTQNEERIKKTMISELDDVLNINIFALPQKKSEKNICVENSKKTIEKNEKKIEQLKSLNTQEKTINQLIDVAMDDNINSIKEDNSIFTNTKTTNNDCQKEPSNDESFKKNTETILEEVRLKRSKNGILTSENEESFDTNLPISQKKKESYKVPIKKSKAYDNYYETVRPIDYQKEINIGLGKKNILIIVGLLIFFVVTIIITIMLLF